MYDEEPSRDCNICGEQVLEECIAEIIREGKRLDEADDRDFLRGANKKSNRRLQNSKSYDIGIKYGYKSGLEGRVAQQILARYGEVHYEETKIRFLQPEKKRFYKPDFVLPNGIIVETKGRFVMADRQKHIWVKEQYPDLDIRFVFTNPNVRISKKSATTYASWCDNYGFIYAKGTIPETWFLEEEKK